MKERRRSRDALALASEANLAIAASPDLDEMLSAIGRRVCEALDVWECDIWEYRSDADLLVAIACWSREISTKDREWLGSVYRLEDWPSHRQMLARRETHEYHADDPTLLPSDRELMARWGERSVLSIPLVFQDEAVGLLTLIEKRGPRRFTVNDMRLLELLAVPAAVAVHNARMFRREAEHNRRLGALLSASRTINATIDLEQLLATIARTAREALDTAKCVIDAYDADGDELIIVSHEHREAEPGREQWSCRRIRHDETLGERDILLGGRIVEEFVSDPEMDASTRAEMLERGDKTHLNVPLVNEGRPIGLLVFVETETERRFTDEEWQVAAALGEQAAAAIHHAQLLRRSELQNRRLGLLLDSMRAISSSVDLDEVLNTVARTAAELLGSEQCQIQEYDAAANTVTPVAMWQRHPDERSASSLGRVLSLDNDPSESAFLAAKEVLEQRWSDPDLPQTTRDAFEAFGDKAYLNVPLIFSGQAVGVLVLVETEYERHWSEDEVALAKGLAEQAAVAIERARLYQRVQDQAVSDGLTGLFNHRHFYDRLDQEIARARRYGTPVSLLMIDIDDFKAFNDRHGHLAGDAVLRTMADVLRAELRQNLDVAARYGGEEFAVILPNTPMLAGKDAQMEMDLAGKLARVRGGDEPPPPGHHGGAEQVAERIRRRVEEAPIIDADGHRLAGLTVSIGVAVFPERTESPEDLVRHADAALYVAKRSGKNRVETYG